MGSSPTPADHMDSPLWLQQSFSGAQIASLVYYDSQYPGQIKAFELVFDEVIDPSKLRVEIQTTLIEQFRKENHPEGNCVQVEHTLRAKKNIFKVLVVCVG